MCSVETWVAGWSQLAHACPFCEDITTKDHGDENLRTGFTAKCTALFQFPVKHWFIVFFRKVSNHRTPICCERVSATSLVLTGWSVVSNSVDTAAAKRG